MANEEVPPEPDGGSLKWNPDAAISRPKDLVLKTEEFKDLWVQSREAEAADWNRKLTAVTAKWSDGAMPTAKSYVNYVGDYTARLRIDYESGVMDVEAVVPQDRAPRQGELLKDVRALFDEALSPAAGAGAPLNVDDLPGRFDLQEIAGRMSRQGLTTGRDGVTRSVFRISMKLVPDHLAKRVERFLPLIRNWSRRNSLDPYLILAIVRQESAFNPRARSGIPAFGLMQVVPEAAGREVLSGRKVVRVPDADFLYQPANNVMVGTRYLAILRDRYLSEVLDPKKRLQLMIVAYNWGPSRVRAALREKRLDPELGHDLLFKNLQDITPKETRDYLQQVLRYQAEFADSGEPRTQASPAPQPSSQPSPVLEPPARVVPIGAEFSPKPASPQPGRQ